MKTPTKISSLESKQYYDEYKESTKLERNKISSKNDLSEKQKKALTNLLHDEMIAEQGTEDFKKHAETRKADYKKIRELVIERVGDPKKVAKEDMQEAVDFFYGNFKKQETKETEKKVPEFEDKNHREKTDETWKIIPEKANIWNEEKKEYKLTDVKVKVNPQGDIKEYVSGVSEKLIGQQLFSEKAVARLGFKDRLPANKGVIEKMIDAQPGKDEQEKYNNFQEKYIKNMFPGCRYPYDEEFHDVDLCMDCWLADGNYAYFGGSGWYCNDVRYDYFFSVRFLKN